MSMINSVLGISKTPFCESSPELLPQQRTLVDTLAVHATMGGFSIIVGSPGVGKTVIREHIEALTEQREFVVVSCSRTLQTYINVLAQLADSFNVDTAARSLEKDLIKAAFNCAQERKTLYTLIDEAHLLDVHSLRKLRLLFDRFPKKHNLVMLGQPELLRTLSLSVNQDIKSRITFSCTLLPLNDLDIQGYIEAQLTQVKLGVNTFDPAAIELIVRSAEGNLRLCKNLCLSSLMEACRQTKKIVAISHVNSVLVQPHWRSHEALIKMQVPTVN